MRSQRRPSVTEPLSLGPEHLAKRRTRWDQNQVSRAAAAVPQQQKSACVCPARCLYSSSLVVVAALTRGGSCPRPRPRRRESLHRRAVVRLAAAHERRCDVRRALGSHCVRRSTWPRSEGSSCRSTLWATPRHCRHPRPRPRPRRRPAEPSLSPPKEAAARFALALATVTVALALTKLGVAVPANFGVVLVPAGVATQAVPSRRQQQLFRLSRCARRCRWRRRTQLYW